MAKVNRSVGKNVDWPQIQPTAIAAVSAGSGNDPAQDTCIGYVPDLSLVGYSLKNQGGIAPQMNVNNMWLRQAAFTSTGSANTAGHATNSYDWRVNVWRKGVLQGCIAYYNFNVATTIGTAITSGNINSYVAVTPASMTGIVPGMILGIDTSTVYETVQVISTTSTTFTAYFTQLHTNSATVTSILVPFQPTAFNLALGVNGATSGQAITASGSATLIPNSIYGFHVGDYVAVTGGTTFETITATTVASTSLTATFAQLHSGTTNVQYLVATTTDTDITHAVTVAVTVASATNIVAGQSLILRGTGADSAKTDTLVVLSVVGTTVTFTTSTSANDYTATINITTVAQLSATTTTVANKPSQVISMASTTGIASGDMVYLQDLTGNSATAAFTGTPELVRVEAVVTNTSITVSPTAVHTNAYAVIPPTKTTFATTVSAAGAATVTLTSGTNFNTGQTGIMVFGGSSTGITDYALVTAVSTYSATLTFQAAHYGSYTMSTSGQPQLNNLFGFNEPFTLKGGDVLSLQRLSNNATGLASPVGAMQLEWVPAQINQ